MKSFLVSLLAVPVFLREVLAFDCSKPPIYVDIHKRVVHGTDVFQYGSFIGIGSPAQNQSLWPSLSQNETTFARVDFCEKSNITNCATSTRGNFDTSRSTTWQELQANSSDDKSILNIETISGKDTLHLYTHFFEPDPASERRITNFSTQVATGGNQAPGIVGMGYSSTLLQGLVDNGMIAGKTYSIYVGSGMDRAGGVINGSNTYGGFDAGRFKEPVHTYAMRIPNKYPISVRVADIVLNEPNGVVRNVSLFDRSQFPDMQTTQASFEAHITTDQYPMVFPYQITQNFKQKVAAEPSGNSDGSLKMTKPFNGTMTIRLDDGFEVTMPWDVMYNTSGITPVADRAQNSTAPFFLSTSFLSQVYLMIDYETYQFHLAEAIAEQKYVMPQTFCPKSTPAPYQAPDRNIMNRASLAGIILGSVIGGLFVITICVVLFNIWRRQRLAKQVKGELEKGKSKMAQFEVDESASDNSGSPKPERKKVSLGKVRLW